MAVGLKVRRLLARTAAPAPEFVACEAIRSSPRSAVVRLWPAGGWQGHDRLIAKRAVGAGADERFCKEVVALRLLGELDISPAVAPRLFAWDRAELLVVLEDLGDQSLATALLGDNRAAAHAALVDYAAALGRMHAGTAGCEARAIAIADEFALDLAKRGNSRTSRIDGVAFQKLCTNAGVSVDAAFDDDVRRVQTWLLNSGRFRALTHGDPCPGNERRTPGGIVFFDFEASGFDHVFLDAAYPVMAFPTCWCAGGIPAAVLAESQAEYRQALASRFPDAEDDTTFLQELQYASARWLLAADTLVPRSQRGGEDHFVSLLAADWCWGRSTARRRLLHRLGAFVNLADASGELCALAATAARVRRALASLWAADARTLPEFPAFATD